MKKQTNNQNTTRIEKLWKYWCFPSFHLFKFMLVLFRLCEHKHRLTWSLASCVWWCEIRRFVGQSPPPSLFCMAAAMRREKGEKNLSVLSSGFLLGKRRLEGRGMVSKKEEVVSLPQGNLLQTVTGHYNNLAAQKSFWRGKSGGNRTGVNNLQHADPEVGRCAWEEGREEDSRGSIWHKNVKKKILLMQA